MNKKIIKITSLLIALFIVFTATFGIDSARAAVPVRETNPDLLRNTRKIANNTKNILKEMKTEWKKNVKQEKTKIGILRYLQQNIANYVIGGSSTDSKPRFVTNWEEYQQQSYEQGKQTAIRDLDQAGFFSQKDFDSLIKSQLSGEPPSSSGNKSSGSNNQKSQLKSGPSPSTSGSGQRQEFDYNSYLNSWLPENNYYGKSMIAKDIVETKGAARAEAAKNEAIASGGFLGAKEGCDQLGANCKITLPGKSVSDILAGALNSEIDYAANAGEGAAEKALAENYSIPTANNPPLVTNVINQQEGGLTGAVQRRAADSSGNRPSDVNSPGGIENRELPSGGIIPVPDTDQSASATFDDLWNQYMQDIINQVEETVDVLVNGMDDSSDYDSSDYDSSDYRTNKIASYQEIQKTIWYLDDLSTLINALSNSLNFDVFSTSDNILNKDPNNNNSNLCSNSGSFTSVSDQLAIINNLRSRLNSLLDSINDDITNTDSSAPGNDETLAASIQNELLKNLFQGTLTVSETANQNFDMLGVLPVNFYPRYPINNNIYVYGFRVQDIQPLDMCINFTSIGYHITARYRQQNTETPFNETQMQTLFKFFDNTQRLRYSGTTSGSGNYLGLSITNPSAPTREFFYFYPGKLSGYLTSIDNRLNELNSNLTQFPDSASLSRLRTYREFKNQNAQEFHRASLYLTDVSSANPNINRLQAARAAAIDDYWTLSPISDTDLASAQTENEAVSNLYAAGLASRANNNFDVTNALPINTNRTTTELTNTSANLRTSLTPFSGNQNFLGLPVNTVFYIHPANIGDATGGYIKSLTDKISQLQSAGFLSP